MPVKMLLAVQAAVCGCSHGSATCGCIPQLTVAAQVDVDISTASHGAEWATDTSLHLRGWQIANMPGTTAEQLSMASTCLHAPSAAGAFWDCALLGKLARGVLAIDRLPGAAAPNRGPSCTLHAHIGLLYGTLEQSEMQMHQQARRRSHSGDMQACTSSISSLQARFSISRYQAGMSRTIFTVQLTWSPQAGWSSLAGCVPRCPAHV